MTLPKPQMNDPSLFPDEAVLQSALGPRYPLLVELEAILKQQNLSGSWNYYQDGKSWLYKAQKGKKTLFWLSIGEGSLYLSFFFTAKTRGGVEQLGLAKAVEERFCEQPLAGKLVRLLLELCDQNALTDVQKLILYKISAK